MNPGKIFYLPDVIYYGIKQEYSLALRLFTYFEIIWLIFWGLYLYIAIVSLPYPAYERVFFFAIFIILLCGPVYYIQFIASRKVRNISTLGQNIGERIEDLNNIGRTEKEKGETIKKLKQETFEPSKLETPVLTLQDELKKQLKTFVEHDVFICHSSQDKPVANAMCVTLEAKGIRCWIAPRDVLPGVNYQEALIDAIDTSKIMVLIFSSHSNNSPHVIRELSEAVSRSIIIIPFRIEDVPLSKSMKYLISLPQWQDALTPPLEQHLEKLAETMQVLLNEINSRHNGKNE